MAELVREFDAGLVVSMRHPESLGELLAQADVERHRRGALALRDHMRSSNQAVLQHLQRCITA
jgi:hypothetical protein